MKTNVGEQVVGEGFIEQSTVGVGSLDRVAAKRKMPGRSIRGSLATWQDSQKGIGADSEEALPKAEAVA